MFNIFLTVLFIIASFLGIISSVFIIIEKYRTLFIKYDLSGLIRTSVTIQQGASIIQHKVPETDPEKLRLQLEQAQEKISELEQTIEQLHKIPFLTRVFLVVLIGLFSFVIVRFFSKKEKQQ